VHPHYFHMSLAEHFADTLGLYQQASELYDMAFAIKNGDSGDYQKATLVWDQAGDPAKAEKYRQKAVTAGK